MVYERERKDAAMPPPTPMLSAPRAEVPAAATPDQAGTTLLIAIPVIVASLYLAREVLIPLTLAVLLSFLLAPLVSLFRRLRLPRAPAVLLSVVLALGVILGLGGIIGTQIAGLAHDVPRYADTVERKIDAVRDATLGRADALIARVSKQFGSATPPPTQAPATQARPAAGASAPAQAAPALGSTPDKPMLVEVREPNPTPLQLVGRYLSPALSPVATLGIVLIVAIFILMQQEDLRDRLIRLVGSGDLHAATVALDDGGRRLSRYFLTQLCVNVGFGLVIGTGLFFIGVPSPVLWGILGALLRFVPYVGSLLSAVLPLALAAAVDPGWSMVIWTAALYFIVEPLVGQVVEPLVYGQSTGLSPVAVVVSAIVWSWLWGPIGLVLSMPLTLVLVVVGRHVKRLEFLDIMLGDRPALTPIESFYQRILAGDSDEARDHAESLLRDRALSNYYDEVALKGLQLAAADLLRGTLRSEQLDRIRTTVKELVEDLDRHEDSIPKDATSKDRTQKKDRAAEQSGVPRPTGDDGATERVAPPASVDADADGLPSRWRAPTAVLCLAGRGPLDEAASEMLVQLLGKHGLGAKLIPFEAASRANIASLDVAGVAMVCISYLEISGNPAHLRYLLERLRRRLPGVPVLVGLWPAEDEVLRNPRMRSLIGADHYTSSLREAVDVCVGTAREAGRRAEPLPGAVPQIVTPTPAAA